MADKLKDFFDRALIASIAGDLRGAYRRLDEGAFVDGCMQGLEDLELTARAGRVAEVIHRFLPPDFDEAAAIIVRALGPELTRTDQFGMAPFRYLPHVFFVGRHGLEHFETSMRVQYELTKRFSAEWSIRAFLVRYPEATYTRLVEWAGDPNVHVRRLVSEGTRPRLPWAPRLRAFQDDPAPVVRLLDRLKDDPERYVQRSVANSLNDIAKDHPDVAVEVCRQWMGDATPGRRWIVGHALRSLVKRGHPGALRALGYGGKPAIELVAGKLEPRRISVGATLEFSFEVASRSAREQELMVDYAVHFVKANGARRPKVFKLRRLRLPPRGRARLEGRVSFAQMTTRKHRPGRHLLEAIVNGVAFRVGEFDVTA